MRRSERGRFEFRTVAALTLTLALSLLLAGPPAAEGKLKDSALIEMSSLAKRIEGLKKGKIDEGKKFRRNVGRVEDAKHDLIVTHFGGQTVHGMEVPLLFFRLERLDAFLREARETSREGFDALVKSNLRLAGGELSNLVSGFGGFATSTAPEAAKTELDVIKNDLRNVTAGQKSGKLDGKKLRKRISRIERAKLALVRDHFSSQFVCGVSFDLFFRLLEGVDKNLSLAKEAARTGKSKQAKSRLATAASQMRALQANYAAVP